MTGGGWASWSQVAVRTLHAYVQAALGEYHAVPGVIACVQTLGSVAHVHPHLHRCARARETRARKSRLLLGAPDPAW